jgi:soluble lytic murein transglycosylase-like protein
MRKLLLVAIVTSALLACSPAKAGERVTLSNGFAMDCNHHALVDGRMRLYLSPGENNYVEVQPDDVTAVERVPDPPAGAARAATAGVNRESTLNPSDLHEILAVAGQEHNIDEDLLASVVKAESNGNAHAVSRAGAQGLMQLMPTTANDLGVTDSFKPDQNVRGGSIYLDALLTRYHDNLALALAAYNAGPAAVDRYHGIPPYRETRLYVARIIHEFNRRVRAREAGTRQTAKPPADSQASIP